MTCSTPSQNTPISECIYYSELPAQLKTIDYVLCQTDTNPDDIITLLYDAAAQTPTNHKKIFLYLVHISKHNPKTFKLLHPSFINSANDWIQFLKINNLSKARLGIGRSLKTEIIRFLKSTTPETITKTQIKTLTRISHPSESDILHLSNVFE